MHLHTSYYDCFISRLQQLLQEDLNHLKSLMQILMCCSLVAHSLQFHMNPSQCAADEQTTT
jgi:hypothetical protein